MTGCVPARLWQETNGPHLLPCDASRLNSRPAWPGKPGLGWADGMNSVLLLNGKGTSAIWTVREVHWPIVRSRNSPDSLGRGAPRWFSWQVDTSETLWMSGPKKSRTVRLMLNPLFWQLRKLPRCHMFFPVNRPPIITSWKDQPITSDHPQNSPPQNSQSTARRQRQRASLRLHCIDVDACPPCVSTALLMQAEASTMEPASLYLQSRATHGSQGCRAEGQYKFAGGLLPYALLKASTRSPFCVSTASWRLSECLALSILTSELPSRNFSKPLGKGIGMWMETQRIRYPTKSLSIQVLTVNTAGGRAIWYVKGAVFHGNTSRWNLQRFVYLIDFDHPEVDTIIDIVVCASFQV